MKKTKINWQTFLIGLFWTGYTLYTLFKYFTGDLTSFRVPKIIGIFYDIIGFLPTMIIQLILGIIFIFLGISKVEVEDEKNEIVKENSLEDEIKEEKV